jgi:hypothetical protein
MILKASSYRSLRSTIYPKITSHVILDKRDPKLLQQEPCKGAETDSRAKFGKETVAETHRRPKWVPHYGAQAAQALIRYAHPRLRYAHPQLRLKQQLLTSRH